MHMVGGSRGFMLQGLGLPGGCFLRVYRRRTAYDKADHTRTKMTQHSFALTARWVTPHRILNIHSFMSVFLGTFRQRSPWDILTPASWSHPCVPYEVLADPRSTPARPTLDRGIPLSMWGRRSQTTPGRAGPVPRFVRAGAQRARRGQVAASLDLSSFWSTARLLVVHGLGPQGHSAPCSVHGPHPYRHVGPGHTCRWEHT